MKVQQVSKMKIALVCTGLGRVLRGFESFTESLFQALGTFAPEMDVSLFQGGGKPAERRFIVPNFHRYDAPARWFGEEIANLLEPRSFALFLYPRLRKGGCDIVHYNEIVMGSVLYHLRRYFGGKFKLLYCNGSPTLPIHYQHRCDFAQMLTRPAYEEARAASTLGEKLSLVPYGVDARRFSTENKVFRKEIRKELQIPEDAKVILTVGMLDRNIKRIGYVLQEISSLRRPVWFIAAGQATEEQPSLEKEAERLIPGRWRFISWPYEHVHRLYGAVDIFTLASLAEGFGLVTIEAMFSGLPVIIHNGPVFQWLAKGTSARPIDMSAPGELARALEEVLSIDLYPSPREEAVKRFSWEALVPQYQKMYAQVMETSSAMLSSKTMPHQV